MKKARKAAFGLTALASVVLFTGADSATSESSICAPREDLVSQLGNQFNESQKAIGLLGDRAVMEVFTSDQGSWTILTTDIEGNSCIVAAGEGWDDVFAQNVGQGV
ncbi:MULTISPECIES: hypothetical protein [Phyllobacteriaceae]|uniref:hypothetical protein n=1 Tax=Phyllobacteriaceae TaxID=69277 RepID=UPI002ACA9372|nr:hypothetical protein [Chelativorans sp. M5D2P16]MDZ5699352.1 hypothetical protein [Chelativorans sp. M5D2P16]